MYGFKVDQITQLIETARARKNDHVVPIPPNKQCDKPTRRPCVMLKARGWIVGAKFNLLCAQTIDSINSCQQPRPLNKNIKLKAQMKCAPKKISPYADEAEPYD